MGTFGTGNGYYGGCERVEPRNARPGTVQVVDRITGVLKVSAHCGRRTNKSVALLTMNKMRIMSPVLLLASAMVMTACATDGAPVSEPGQAQAPSTAARSTTITGPTAGADATSTVPPTSADPTAADNPNCAAAELSVSLATPRGAAGSTELPIEFTNIGDRTCRLVGYPGVSYVSSRGGARVGQAAVRSESDPVPVELVPGAVAVSTVKAAVVENYPAGACVPTAVSGIDVYSPNTTEVVYLAYPTTGCSSVDPSITQLAVQPVEAE